MVSPSVGGGAGEEVVEELDPPPLGVAEGVEVVSLPLELSVGVAVGDPPSVTGAPEGAGSAVAGEDGALAVTGAAA